MIVAVAVAIFAVEQDRKVVAVAAAVDVLEIVSGCPARRRRSFGAAAAAAFSSAILSDPGIGERCG